MSRTRSTRREFLKEGALGAAVGATALSLAGTPLGATAKDPGAEPGRTLGNGQAKAPGFKLNYAPGLAASILAAAPSGTPARVNALAPTAAPRAPSLRNSRRVERVRLMPPSFLLEANSIKYRADIQQNWALGGRATTTD